MEELFEDPISHSPRSLIERLEKSDRLKQGARRPGGKLVLWEAIAFMTVWTLILSFGAAVWYWLISGASAYLAYLK
jgi:hypothetical protein